MGNIHNRSSSDRSRKVKSKNSNQNPMGELALTKSSIDDGRKFFENHKSDMNKPNSPLPNTIDEWKVKTMANMANDPPGAPSTYPSNYMISQNDPMTQSITSHYDRNNTYYPSDQATFANVSKMSYDINQYPTELMLNRTTSQAQQIVIEERPSKKVQFANPIQQPQQQTAPNRKPLTNTQSWHDPSHSSNDGSMTIMKDDLVLNRSNANRVNTTNSVSIQKPIYVGIDHGATLAGRRQTKSNNSHKKGLSDSTNPANSRRAHKQKHQETIGQSTPKIPKQENRSNATRTLTTTSTMTPMQNLEWAAFSESDVKLLRTRDHRQPVSQHNGDEMFADNNPKSVKLKGSSSQKSVQNQQADLSLQRIPIHNSDNVSQAVATLKFSNGKDNQRNKQSLPISVTRTRV